jgi:predicted metal-binding membrane protein
VTLARRARAVILASLLGLTAAAWAVVLRQSAAMPMGRMDNALTMDMEAGVFLAVWVAMMAAMMFPTALPMVLTFARVQAQRGRRGSPYVPTWAFVSAYMVVWTAFGALAYVIAAAGGASADEWTWLGSNAARIGGVLMILTGLYELSPLKDVCLSKCRSPLAFVHSSWRDGYGGAMRMGLEHGMYCLGCCWLFFVVVFPLGMINVGVLAALVLLIFAEKSLPFGHAVRRLAAGVFLAYGAVVVILPAALPSTM